MKDLRLLQLEAYQAAKANGFHEGLDPAGRDGLMVRLALVHTKVSEATQIVKREWTGQGTEALREKLGSELADVLIRIFDMAGSADIDLEEAVVSKMRYNATRGYRYGTPDAKETR